METSLENQFADLMLHTNKHMEKLLVAWISQYSNKPSLPASFDILHESLDAVYEACDKVGMTLFLPKGLLDSDHDLASLVDAIREFWSNIKKRNVFEICGPFFRSLIDDEFVFEDHLETYILDHKEVEFALMVFLLLTFMMVRRRGNRSAMEESRLFENDPHGEDFLQKVVLLLDQLDALWEDAPVSDSDVRRGTVVGGDIGLLRQIEKLKQDVADLTGKNQALTESARTVDQRLAEKDEAIETLKREKQAVAESKEELLRTIEGMKQEWLQDALKDKQAAIDTLEEDIRRKVEDFEEEIRELSETLEAKKQDNQRLSDELQKAHTGYSEIGFRVDREETESLRRQCDDLERQLNDQNKKYMDLLERNTELDQKFREEQFRYKQQQDTVEDLRERLQFYTQRQTGGNQLAEQPIDISNLAQSEFGSLLQDSRYF